MITWAQAIVLGIALLVLDSGISYAIGYYKGGQAYDDKAKIAGLKASTKVLTIERGLNEASGKISQRQEDQKEVIKTVYRYIDRKVADYEQTSFTSAPGCSCDVPVGLVRLHNASASNVMPDAAAAADDYDPGVPVTDYARKVAENYAIAWEWKAERDACRSWGQQVIVEVNKNAILVE